MSEKKKRFIAGLLLFFSFYILYTACPPLYLSIVLAVALVYIMLVEWPLLFAQQPLKGLLLAPFYPIAPMVILIMLNHHPIMHDQLFLLIMMVAASDVGAYYGGMWLGKHRLAPTISPHKTWEGFIVGLFSCCVVFFSMTLYGQEKCFIVQGILFSFVISVASLLGDLFESWLKRRARVKDVGSLIPGHGGLLDRLDSLLFAVIVFYILWAKLF